MTEWTEWKIPRKHRGRPGRGATPDAPHFPTEMRSGISEECRIIFTRQTITQPLKPPSAPASVEPFSFSRLVAPVAPAKAEEKAGMRADDRTLCALEFPMPRSSRGDEALKSPPEFSHRPADSPPTSPHPSFTLPDFPLCVLCVLLRNNGSSRFSVESTRAWPGAPGPATGSDIVPRQPNPRLKTYARIGWFNLVSWKFNLVSWAFSLVSCWFGWFRRGADTVAGLTSPAASRRGNGSPRSAGSRPTLQG